MLHLIRFLMLLQRLESLLITNYFICMTWMGSLFQAPKHQNKGSLFQIPRRTAKYRKSGRCGNWGQVGLGSRPFRCSPNTYVLFSSRAFVSSVSHSCYLRALNRLLYEMLVHCRDTSMEHYFFFVLFFFCFSCW